MNVVQTSLSSPRTSRIIFWVGAALLVAALVVFIIKRSDNGSSNAVQSQGKAASAINPQQLLHQSRQAPTGTSKKFSQIDPKAQLLVKRFILDGAAEKNLARAWTEAAPSLRSGFTKHEWVHGNALPFQVFPELDTTKPFSMTLRSWSPRAFLVDIGLGSTQKVGRGAFTFQLGAVKVGKGANARWLVNYWMPLYTPPVRADPSQSFGG
jgi:hypothetical protein